MSSLSLVKLPGSWSQAICTGHPSRCTSSDTSTMRRHCIDLFAGIRTETRPPGFKGRPWRNCRSFLIILIQLKLEFLLKFSFRALCWNKDVSIQTLWHRFSTVVSSFFIIFSHQDMHDILGNVQDVLWCSSNPQTYLVYMYIYIYILCVFFFSLQISYLLGILNFCVHAGWSRVCACACVCLFACPSNFACLHACLPMCLCLAFLPARKPVSESSRALVATSWAHPLRALSVWLTLRTSIQLLLCVYTIQDNSRYSSFTGFTLQIL